MKSKMPPQVSVILPNLNTRPFLEERLETIASQTFTDWELIIVDSYSEDGSWELFQEYAKQDSRARLFQVPRGLYQSWNYGIQLARGKYIYIATSDDTMMPDCLEKMVTALEAHPDCDICDVNLVIIDEAGNERKELRETSQLSVRYYGDIMNKLHIRLAPYDGLLHYAFETVYTSITQLLIRTTVFEKVGYFRTDWGPKGDFEWKCRASLVCNTIHLPESLATWRYYSGQLTSHQPANSQHYDAMLEMIDASIDTLEKYNADFYRKLDTNKLAYLYKRKKVRLIYNQFKRRSEKLKDLMATPAFSLEFLMRYLMYPQKNDFLLLPIDQEKNDFQYIQRELNRLNLGQSIIVLE